MARWLVQSPGVEPYGPVDASELQEAWRRREIPPGTTVCAEGFTHWAPFHELAELVGGAAPAQVARPTAMPRWVGSILLLLVLLGVGVLVLVGVVGVQVASRPSSPGVLPCSR